jgi:hypothetical protein
MEREKMYVDCNYLMYLRGLTVLTLACSILKFVYIEEFVAHVRNGLLDSSRAA